MCCLKPPVRALKEVASFFLGIISKYKGDAAEFSTEGWPKHLE